MSMEIQPNAVYTTEETQRLLKVSQSTVKRLLKRGLIRANKIGKQYRILGIELLRLLSPVVEEKAVHSYLEVKKRVVERLNTWDV